MGRGVLCSAIKLRVGWVVRAGPSTVRQLSSHSLLWLCGQRLSRNLTASFHIITAFLSPALLSMLSKMFCSVLKESVALIIHNATPLLPSCLVTPLPALIYYPLYCFQHRPFYHCHICEPGDEIYSVVAEGTGENYRNQARRKFTTDCIFF